MKRQTAGEKRMSSIVAQKNKREEIKNKKIAEDHEYFKYTIEKICPDCGKDLADDEYSRGYAWRDGPMAFIINCKSCMFFYESYYYNWEEKCKAFHLKASMGCG